MPQWKLAQSEGTSAPVKPKGDTEYLHMLLLD